MLTPDSTRNPLKPWQRRVAWTLIAALANPAAVLPLSLYSSVASARDTDIYLSTPYAGSTAEPAILLILDTSDSMNLPEGWREYPGAYDSHVEYLWNDDEFIKKISPTAMKPPDSTSTKTEQDDYKLYARKGFWSEELIKSYESYIKPEDIPDNIPDNVRENIIRDRLKKHLTEYTLETEAGDPDSRRTSRNYNDAKWIFWLPAGAPETDPRLWSNAFNRWAGGVAQSDFPAQVRGGIDYGSPQDSREHNQCKDSLEKLLPSTVFAPTTYPRNTGKYLNQQWQRWEPYLSLRNGRQSNSDTTYPGTLDTKPIPSEPDKKLQIHSTSVVGAVDSQIRAQSEFLGTAGGGEPTGPFPVRDSSPRSAPFSSWTDIGDQGQPIRTQDPASSRSGWTDLKADMGGFNFQSYVNSIEVGGYDSLFFVLRLYCLTLDPNEQPLERRLSVAKHTAWKGNRDAFPKPPDGTDTTVLPEYCKTPSVPQTIDSRPYPPYEEFPEQHMTGTPAYYDSPKSLLRLADPTKIPTSVCTRRCVIDATSTQCNDAGITGVDQCSTSPPPACDSVPKIIPSINCKWKDRKLSSSTEFRFYYGGTCSGTCTVGACSFGESSPSYCDIKLPDLPLPPAFPPTDYPYASLNSSDGCVEKPDTSSTTKVCTDQTSKLIDDKASPYDDYYVYPLKDKTDYLVHDCKADNGTSGNPGSGFMATNRPFGQLWGFINPETKIQESYTPTDPSANYHAVDMYSVNYLNWKFGPKMPNGAPIGRKTRLQIAKDAFTYLVENTNGVRFGLMVFNRKPADSTGLAGTEGSQGGNVAYAIRRMGSSSTDSDSKNRGELSKIINGVVATGSTPLTEVMYEAYLYFRGETPKFGTNSTPAVGGGTVSDDRDPSAVGTVSEGRDPSAIVGGKYDSPMMSNPQKDKPASCQKNYVVLVSDGGPDNDNQADKLVKALTQSGTPEISTQQDKSIYSSGQFEPDRTTSPGVPYGPPDISYPANYIWLDELTHFMAQGDMSPGGATDSDSIPGTQSVSTYTIGFAGGSSPVLEHAATSGGGTFYEAKDSGALSTALAKAIETIRDWNPTLAAPTVPISATNRAESSDDIFLAFFGPRLQQCWEGTVKKFRLSTNPEECGKDIDDVQIPLCLTYEKAPDTWKNIEEFDTSKRTARVRDAAVSAWSDPAKPDGSKPNAGGTGHVLKTASGSTPATRNLYTHLSSSTEKVLTDSSNAMSEDNKAITKELLGDPSMRDAMRATIINYARGGDPTDAGCKDASSATACSTWRAWPHGDVLHSNPAILIYDSDKKKDPADSHPVVYLFYMSNDGLLHAVDTKDGKEQWAFMPEEYLPKLKTMYENPIGEHLITGDGSPKIYFEDKDQDGKIDKAYLAFGMRRGGRAVYALDITDKAKPQFLWKIDNNTKGFEELGETWSAPAFTRMRASTNPVLVFGAGYDPVPNDQISVTITLSGTKATATTPVDHGYSDGQEVRISGATEEAGYKGYNGDAIKIAVKDSPRSFTYTPSPLPSFTPAKGTVKVESKADATMGRGVFFVDALDGTLIRSFTPRDKTDQNTQVSKMDFSIPSDATPLNTDLDSNGYADRLYLGDLGGNVWRFDIDSDKPSDWTAIKFAYLSNDDDDKKPRLKPRRKIFFPPAVVKQLDQGQRFDAVYVGTGDRENPLRTDNDDLMFMIKDTDTGLTTAKDKVVINYPPNEKDKDKVEIGFYDLTDNLVQFGTEEQITAVQKALQGKQGWAMKLDQTLDRDGKKVDGEKVVNAPSVFFNILRFGSYSPFAAASASACVPLGKGTNYAMDARNGSVVVDTDHDGTITSKDSRVSSNYSIRGFPSDVIVVIRDGKIFAGSCSDGNCGMSQIGTVGALQRAYWFQEAER